MRIYEFEAADGSNTVVMGLLHWLSCVLVVLALGAAPAAATAEVMSHVTAHFGQMLEDCREEVRFNKKSKQDCSFTS